MSVHIQNAGLVLTAPFQPRLFESLHMLRHDDDGVTRFVDIPAAIRAMHVLQYLVDGRQSEAEPPGQWSLNRLLIGLPLEGPIYLQVQLTEHEISMCDELLKAMIANWTAISTSSVTALRETFLRRAGTLEFADDRWKLRVQRKTVDVLVDQIPWSIATIHHPWMLSSLHVTW